MKKLKRFFNRVSGTGKAWENTTVEGKAAEKLSNEADIAIRELFEKYPEYEPYDIGAIIATSIHMETAIHSLDAENIMQKAL